MSYGVKYRIGWRGDRRERLEYDIQILERDYTGSATEAYLMGDGVVLTYGKQDDDELVPFKPSTATLSLFCNDEQADFSDLYTSDPLKYKVLIAESRNSIWVPRWVGYISTGRYSRPWGRPPFKVTIEANDGMEALMNIPYQVDSTTRHTDTLTIRSLLERLVEPLGVWPVNMSNIPKISPSQVEDSADVIGIAANTIYEAFNNEVPSHYDLLIAVLRHFGLQAYFEGEKLCVRSVLGLASLSRPDWAGSLESSFGQTPLTFVPLEDSMSVEAELSYVPALKSLTIDSQASEGRLLSMLDPQRWAASATGNWDGLMGFASVRSGREGLLLESRAVRKSSTANKIGTGWLKYSFEGWLEKSTSSIAMDCELFDRMISLRAGEATTTPVMSVLFILVPEDEYNDDILQPQGNSLTEIPPNSYMWDESGKLGPVEGGKTWDEIGSNGRYGDASLFQYGFQVAINAQEVSVQQARRLPTRLLKGTQASFELTSIPGEDGVRYRLVMLVGSAAEANNFCVEMLDPVISISRGGVDNTEEPSNIVVNSEGSGDLSYKQGFDESYTSRVFTPSIVVSETNEAAYRYVMPAMRAELSRGLGGKLRDMRSAVTRQLDGEVAVARPLSLNTLWSDNSGSAYYTNYIRMKLKRGVSEVQLRELIPLREKSAWTMNTSMANARYVSNDSTALAYVTTDTTGIYLLMPSSRSYRKLDRALTISKGVDSMIAVRTSVIDSADYSLTAYGDGGVILSKLASLSNILATLTNTGTNPTPSISMAYATSYDATTGMWVIPEISRSTCKIYLADATGSAIAKHTITGEGTIRRVVVISGGFVVVDYISATNIKTTSYYYNLYGELESYTDICSANEELVDMNDVYAVLYQGPSGIALREIKSTRNEMLKGKVLFAGSKTALTYVDMNCALVLFRNSLGEALIYDGRTRRRVVVSDGTQGAAQKYMLIGECVYAPDGLNLYETRILEGM